MKFIDLSRQKFGRWTVLRRVANNPSNHVQYLCKCNCGNEQTIFSGTLRSKKTQSCGCLRRDLFAITKKTHGLSETRTYRIWGAMKSRCSDSQRPDFHRYGGRGISVCAEWEEFKSFYQWAMANGYGDETSIDRIDNDKGYSPENCRWATSKEQNNNRRNNHIIEFGGQRKTLTSWAQHTGIRSEVLRNRLKRGWSVEKALTCSLRGN